MNPYCQERLEIEGAIKIGISEAASPAPGTIQWKHADLLVWNGSKWISLTKGQALIDIDGNVYQTVKIGGKEWMAENLRTSKFRDGTSIPQITDNTLWANTTSSAWCWYNNDNPFEKPYGKLYNGYAVNDSRGLCPVGWDVPTNAEWTIMTDLFGGLNFAGGPLKKEGTIHWESPNTGATNESGFYGLPGGSRFSNGSFFLIRQFGFWWSGTEVDSEVAWFHGLLYNDVIVNRNSFNKKYGLSVRCVKN